MSANNPYATPQAPLTTRGTESGGVGDLNIFTAAGRLGRIRYLMYTMGVGLLGGIIAMLLFMIPVVGIFLGIAAYVGLMAITFLLTIQRCHDFNKTGWLSLIVLIPLVSLVFYFWPGTQGENDYGHQPPPNSTAIKIGAFLLLGLFVLSMVAAIALPAYQEYAIRAAG
ncbi:DUF805 domain-containing protein [uncultured Cocleimonas sp.]|uniref:DUF805 domain-containing protein n=1 Tax=uncultured Cocleimonas sp. TaxID=1051587 RepID=UPI002627D589|nr:DUF805 domain-containing protein [uncultured Cocleimonas sp.]